MLQRDQIEAIKQRALELVELQLTETLDSIFFELVGYNYDRWCGLCLQSEVSKASQVESTEQQYAVLLDMLDAAIEAAKR